MYSFVFISLLLVQSYGAPIDLDAQPSDEVVYEVKVTPPTEPVLYETPETYTMATYEDKVTPPLEAVHYDTPDTHIVDGYEDKMTPPSEPIHYETPIAYTVADNYGVDGKEETTSMAYDTTDAYEVTTLSPPSIVVIEETRKDTNVEKEKILTAGKHLSEAITAKIVGPIVIFNSKVAAAAGALPPLLAAKGAMIGSAIATPIEIGAVAGSSIVSGMTGKLVAIPITVGAGTVAKFVGAAEKGKEVWDFNVQHGGEILKDGAIRMGHIILKPIAVIVGAQTALTGAGLGITGAGIKGVGVGIETVGAKMLATGVAAKGLGATLIKSQFVK